MAFQNVLALEKRIGASIYKLFNTQVGGSSAPTPVSPPPVPVAQVLPQAALVPIDVAGFYKVTGPQEVTFYATTDIPVVPVGSGWSGVGFLGILGQIQVTSVKLKPGPGYNWSFTLQSDTTQNIEGVQQTIGAMLYPPNQTNYVSSRTQVPLYGYYTITQNVVTFVFTAPPPPQTSTGWTIVGLPTFSVPLKVTYISEDFGMATLVPTDGSLPANIAVPVYVNGVPAMIQEPAYSGTFTPGYFTTYVSPRTTIPDVQVQINSNVHVGTYPQQRDLNTDVAWSQEDPTRLFPQNDYKEVNNKGFSSGSLLALQATGPQDKFLLADDLTKSLWNPEFKQYSNFVMYQKVYPFPPPNSTYQGQSVQIELRPTELGHLLSNMYLSVTLPALPNGKSYTPNVGRALLKQVDLLVNETIVETLYDDWYVIRDQVFLDGDEQLGLQTALNPSSATSVTYVGTGGDTTVATGTNIIHTFLSSNTFTLNYGTYMNVLVVGGGGAGAPTGNGGGGGGVVVVQNVFVPAGTYAITIGSGGTQSSSNGGASNFGTLYGATGGKGGAFGGTSGTGYASNVSFTYLSNVAYASGAGAGASSNVTTGTGSLAFTSPLTLGSGGSGVGVSDILSSSTAYYGGGGGGASNTSITGTLETPGGVGGGGVGSVNVFGSVTQTLSVLGSVPGLSNPLGVATDPGSNVYVADSGNNVVRKFNSTGTSVTNIGLGSFNGPRGIAVDAGSNVYVSDTQNNAVKKVNGTTGVITTYTPPSFGFTSPSGIAIDSSANVFVVSPTQGNVFKINSTSLAVSNLARPSIGWYGLNDVAVDAKGNVFVTQTTNISVVNSTTSAVSNISTPPGGWNNVIGISWFTNVYITDTYNNNVWSYNVATSSYTLLATSPNVLYPTGIASDYTGSNVFISNTGTNQVERIYQGSVTTFSTLGSAAFNNPQGAVSDSYGNIYVASTYENSIKKVLPNGTILNLAFGNFNAPQDVAIDSQGRIYVADTNNSAIKRMNSDGSNVVSLGSGFAYPQGVAVDSAGNVYVSDTGNQQVKVILTNGTIQTLQSPVGGWGAPAGLSVDSSGNVYVADAGLVGVYIIPIGGGVAYALSSPAGGWRVPYTASVDSQGNVYVADAGYTGVFKNTTQILTGSFSTPFGIFVETTGNILVADTGHNSIQRINNGATSGAFGTGGGGGGSFGTTAGAGGSGVVVLSYASPQSIVPQSTITIPLEFFFCRRHSHNNKGRERLRKPYFPVCAMWNQRLYVRFTFQPNTWWCNAPVSNNTDVYPPGTTLWPNLVTEEILLENREKLYYQNTPLKYIVNRVQKESSLFFNSASPTLQLTANYPVQVLAWFFRNKNYEKTTDGRYYASRYSYGYSTQYIQTGVVLQFPSGQSNFVDVIDTAKITLNNVDILSTFQGSLYYSFKQPMEHSLSIPSKNIYVYSFGLSPREYNQGGYLNFAKLNSQTTYIQLNFNATYTNQIINGYNLYLFYYGYGLLQFQNGFASLPYL